MTVVTMVMAVLMPVCTTVDAGAGGACQGPGEGLCARERQTTGNEGTDECSATDGATDIKRDEIFLRHGVCRHCALPGHGNSTRGPVLSIALPPSTSPFVTSGHPIRHEKPTRSRETTARVQKEWRKSSIFFIRGFLIRRPQCLSLRPSVGRRRGARSRVEGSPEALLGDPRNRV